MWTVEQQHRFEDRVSQEVHSLRNEVKGLADRVTLLLGAIALLAFAIPVIAPFVRNLLGVP
jgi:hypothetical protein